MTSPSDIDPFEQISSLEHAPDEPQPLSRHNRSEIGYIESNPPTPNGTPPLSARFGVEDSTEKIPIHQQLIEYSGPLKSKYGYKYATQQHQIAPYPPIIYKNNRKQIKTEILAGITVAFAQVSESIAFTFIAGVGPLLGLHAAWIMGIFTSILGSRSSMIFGATGVRAAVIAPYIKRHGIGITFYIILAVSLFQYLGGLLKISKFVRMVPRPAMVGFVNGLAIILALGQISQFQIPGTDEFYDIVTLSWMFFIIVATVVVSIYFPKIPRIGKILPPSLLGILIAMFIEFAIVRPSGFQTPTVGDLGTVTGGFPQLFFLDPQYNGKIPSLSWELAGTVFVPGFIAAAAGMVEALMTIEVVNDLTETTNPKPDQLLFALATGNFVSGLFGTIGGGATIGLSIINIQNGSNGYFRISGIVASITMFLIILVASPIIQVIPSASLVGVMVIVCYSTFELESLPMIFFSYLPKQLRSKFRYAINHKISRNDAFVIILVTVVTLVMDLFTAVLLGILYTAASFAWNSGNNLSISSQLFISNSDGSLTPFEKELEEIKDPESESDINLQQLVETVIPQKPSHKIISVSGPLFFASAMEFIRIVQPHRSDPPNIEIHFKKSQLYDFTAIHALNVVGEKYTTLGKQLHIRHLGPSCFKMLKKADKLATHFTYELEPEQESFAPTSPHTFHVLSRVDHL